MFKPQLHCIQQTRIALVVGTEKAKPYVINCIDHSQSAIEKRVKNDLALGQPDNLNAIIKLPSAVDEFLSFRVCTILGEGRKYHVRGGFDPVETELEASESSNRITGHTRSSAGTRSGVTIVL